MKKYTFVQDFVAPLFVFDKPPINLVKKNFKKGDIILVKEERNMGGILRLVTSDSFDVTGANIIEITNAGKNIPIGMYNKNKDSNKNIVIGIVSIFAIICFLKLAKVF